MTDDKAYYTDDITLMPVTMIGRVCRRLPWPAGLGMFGYFLVRKLLRWRRPANYGVLRPESLPFVSIESLPDEVQAKVDPYVRACHESGFDLVGCIVPKYIGGKAVYMPVLLDATGNQWATPSWIRLEHGTQVVTRVVFACHSLLHNGVELHTGAVPPEDWHPELIPPDQQIVRLPADTSAHQVIAAHARRVAETGALLTRFNPRSLREHCLRSSLKLFDYMVAKGRYAPLTKAEVLRLSQHQLTEPRGEQSITAPIAD